MPEPEILRVNKRRCVNSVLLSGRLTPINRNTLTALLNVASWLKRKPGTPELSLERPLFDTEVLFG